MGLFRRIGDIISANLNEMVEEYEDPQKMLKQAVREMESAISTAMNSAARVITNEKLLSKRVSQQDAETEYWQQKAQKALRSSDEDGTRQALRRRREHEKLKAALIDEFKSAQSSSQKLRRQIDAMRVRLDEAKRKLALLSARKQAADARQQLLAECGESDFSETAFSKFDRMCEKVDHAETHAEALLELSITSLNVEDQNNVDSVDDDIELDLQQLKRECGMHE